MPNMTLATDIICGFPNETEADFDETLALVGKYKFAILNISQFYPRPGTPAAKMKRIATNIVKDRSRRLTKLFESFVPYTHYVGTTILVWFDVEVSSDGRHSVGHSKAYVKVLVPYDATLPGSCYTIRIVGHQRFHIEGVLVEQVNQRNAPSAVSNGRSAIEGSVCSGKDSGISGKNDIDVVCATCGSTGAECGSSSDKIGSDSTSRTFPDNRALSFTNNHYFFVGVASVIALGLFTLLRYKR